jgi:hypothetical protein
LRIERSPGWQPRNGQAAVSNPAGSGLTRSPVHCDLKPTFIHSTMTAIALSPFVALIAVTLSPLVALIAGILILIVPRLLNFIVAIYLIVIGLLGLLHM